MNERKKILGISDDQESCCCCGRTGLKRVVYIEDMETGDVAWFGVVCATKKMGALFGTPAKIEAAAKTAAAERAEAIRAELAASPEAAALRQRARAWEAFKSAHAIKPGARHSKLFARFTRDAKRAERAKRAAIEAARGRF